ncbi:MAG TPA: hypothetical protein V6D47_06765 [Oscillatoriaceae cyanobacterium]
MNRRGIPFWLFASFLCLYVLTSSGHFSASDDLQKLLVLDAIFKHGTLAIPGGWVHGHGGQYYSWFPLGASLLMLPGYLIGQLALHWFPALPAAYVVRFFVTLDNAVFSAALVTLVALYARKAGRSWGASVFAAIALGLATMVWPYAKTAWSEPGATLALFAGCFALLLARRATGAASARWFFAAGTGLALGAFVRQEYALVGMAAFAWCWFAERRSWRQLVPFVLPLAAIAFAHLWYNAARYDAPLYFPNYQLPQGARLQEEGRFGSSLLRDFYQYVASPNQGLFWFSPALLLACAGLRRFVADRASQAGLLAVVLLPLAAFYVVGWGVSSWAWGLRYVYPLLPFLILPVAWWWDASRRARLAGCVVLALGIGVQFLGVVNDADDLYAQAMRAHPGLTIQRVMTEPDKGPLVLALEATPGTLERGAVLVAAPQSGHGDYHTRRLGLPDCWWILQLLSPLPRKLTAIAVLANLLALLGSIAMLIRGLRPSTQATPAERGLATALPLPGEAP